MVLPWLLGLMGAPTYLNGLLVPIRESLALLPQMAVGGVILRFPVRKGFWAGAALSNLNGTAAGWTVIGLLVLFASATGLAVTLENVQA